jgi:hypothetical protein
MVVSRVQFCKCQKHYPSPPHIVANKFYPFSQTSQYIQPDREVTNYYSCSTARSGPSKHVKNVFMRYIQAMGLYLTYSSLTLLQTTWSRILLEKSCTACQEILHLICDMKVNFHINIILPSMPRSPLWSGKEYRLRGSSLGNFLHPLVTITPLGLNIFLSTLF